MIEQTLTEYVWAPMVLACVLFGILSKRGSDYALVSVYLGFAAAVTIAYGRAAQEFVDNYCYYTNPAIAALDFFFIYLLTRRTDSQVATCVAWASIVGMIISSMYIMEEAIILLGYQSDAIWSHYGTSFFVLNLITVTFTSRSWCRNVCKTFGFISNTIKNIAISCYLYARLAMAHIKTFKRARQ